MAKIDHDPDAPSDWLEALYEAVADGRDDQFEHPEIETVAEDHVDAVRDCFRLLERVRRARDSSIAGPAANASENGTASDTPRHVGRFRIVRELGRGGFGIVFLAFDPRIGRNVALKVPRPEILVAPSMRRRFLREAEAAGALEHPNLIPIYEVGEQGPVCYIASAYCAGPNLSRWLADRSESVPIRSAAQLVGTLARGVEHAHRRGVLHRDIKPANVLLEPAGEQASVDDLSSCVPRLTDFGLAKVLEVSADETRTGSLLGTPAYMAPEQAEGRLADIGPSTDVYALGVVLYELLVGRPPFRGQSDVQTLQQVSRGDPLRPNRFRQGLSKDLEAIVLKCLEHDPARRYGSAIELAGDLDRFLAGAPTLARPAGPIEKSAKWVRRRPAIASLLAVVVVATLSLTGGGWWYSGQLRVALDEARTYATKATDRELETKHFLYATDVSLAERTLAQDNTQQARNLLTRNIPAEGQPDLRGYAWHHLWRQLDQEVLTLRGHTSDVYCVCYSRDGRLLATASRDRTARVWDRSNGQCLAILAGPETEVNSVAFTSDGKHVATAADDGTVRIWNWATAKSIYTFVAHEGSANCVVFSPDGNCLATTGADKCVRLWETINWHEVSQLIGFEGDIARATFSPTGGLLAAAGGDGAVRVWDIATNNLKLTVKNTPGLSSVAFNSDATEIASTGRGARVIRAHDVATGEQKKQWGPFYGSLHDAVYVNHDRELAFATRTGELGIIDLKTSKVKRKLFGHTARIWDLAVSPNSLELASASGDRTVKVWDLTRGNGHEVAGNSVRSACALALTSDGRTLAVAGGDGKISVWDVASRQVRWQGGRDFEITGDFNGAGRRDSGYFQDGVWHLEIAPNDDAQDASDGIERTVTLGMAGDIPVVGDWNRGGRDLLGVYRPSSSSWHFDIDGNGEPAEQVDEYGTAEMNAGRDIPEQVPVVGRWGSTGRAGLGLAIFHGNRWVFCLPSSYGDGRVYFEHGDKDSVPIVGRWDTSGKDGVALLDDNGLWIDLAHSGKWPEFVVDHPGHSEPRRVQACNRPELDSVTLVEQLPIDDATVEMARDRAAGKRRTSIEHLAISPAGDLLAVHFAKDSRVRIWDARTGRRTAVLQAGLGAINGLAIAPDGCTLAVSTNQGEFTLWDLATLQQRGRIVGSKSNGKGLAFAPDGKRLARRGEEQTIQIWDTENLQLLATLQSSHDISTFAFSPDGTLIAVAGEDRVIDLWNVKTAGVVAMLVGHGALVHSLSFSPDGTCLASAENDCIKLWDLPTRQELFTLPGPSAVLGPILFHPDGRQLIACGESADGGELHFWSVDSPAPVPVNELSRMRPEIQASRPNDR